MCCVAQLIYVDIISSPNSSFTGPLAYASMACDDATTSERPQCNVRLATTLSVLENISLFHLISMPKF
jgi:hypothetical protein